MGQIELSVDQARRIVEKKDERYLVVERKWIDEKKGVDTFYAVVEDKETGLFYKTTYDSGRKWTTGDVILPFDWDSPVFIEVKKKVVQKIVWEEV